MGLRNLSHGTRLTYYCKLTGLATENPETNNAFYPNSATSIIQYADIGPDNPRALVVWEGSSSGIGSPALGLALGLGFAFGLGLG